MIVFRKRGGAWRKEYKNKKKVVGSGVGMNKRAPMGVLASELNSKRLAFQIRSKPQDHRGTFGRILLRRWICSKATISKDFGAKYALVGDRNASYGLLQSPIGFSPRQIVFWRGALAVGRIWRRCERGGREPREPMSASRRHGGPGGLRQGGSRVAPRPSRPRPSGRRDPSLGKGRTT